MDRLHNRSTSTRRAVLAAGACAAMSGVLGACATPAQGGPDAPGSTAGTRVATLRTWHWDNFQIDPQTRNGQDLTARFPKVKVELELVPQNQYVDKFVAQVSGGAAPDVIGVTVTGNMNAIPAKGMLSPLDSQIKRDKYDLSDFYDPVLRPHQWNGKQVGLPYHWTTLVWFYNEQLFRRVGAKTPYEHWKAGTWTWDTYMDFSHSFRRLGDDLFGTATLPAANHQLSFPLLWSNGGEAFDAQFGKSLLDQTPALDALEFMYRASQLAPKGDQAGTSTPAAGKVAMWSDWLPRYYLYRTQLTQLMQYAYGYGVVPPPAAPRTKKSVSLATGVGWSVVREGKNQDEAWALVQQLVSPDAMRRNYRETGSPPARKSVAASRDFWKTNPDLPSPEVMLEMAEAGARTGRPLPRISNLEDIRLVMVEELGAAWADKQSVKDAALKSAQRATALLKEGTVSR